MSSAREISEQIESDIDAGRLTPGEALPSIRTQAQRWGVSPGTVAQAYRTLRSRGVITARPGQSTRVSPRSALSLKPSIKLTEGQRDLSHGNPDPEMLPQLDRALGQLDPRPHLYGEPTLNRELAEMASAQFRRDGIETDDVAVVGGAIDGLERLLTVHTRAGDDVLVEDPSYMMVLDLLRTLGRNPVPMAVDERGAVPSALAQGLKRRPRACIFVPRAQNPTGAAFDGERAAELRAVLATAPEVVVIENDHAGPVAGTPYHTLTTDRERWAVVRTVSKTLGPDLRLATLAGDNGTIRSLIALQLISGSWVSNLLQQLVANLWRDPATEDLWNRAGKVYAERRTHLLTALRRHHIEACGSSGLNVVIPVEKESLVVGSLLQEGWLVRAGETYRIDSPPFIRITTAALEDDEVDPLVAALVRTLRPSPINATYG